MCVGSHDAKLPVKPLKKHLNLNYMLNVKYIYNLKIQAFTSYSINEEINEEISLSSCGFKVQRHLK